MSEAIRACPLFGGKPSGIAYPVAIAFDGQQLAFFSRVEPRLDLRHWDVYETGWPYARGGMAKQAISATARAMGGKSLFGTTFGNRFRGMFVLSKLTAAEDKPAP